jgi:hypothetical protein
LALLPQFAAQQLPKTQNDLDQSVSVVVVVVVVAVVVVEDDVDVAARSQQAFLVLSARVFSCDAVKS